MDYSKVMIATPSRAGRFNAAYTVGITQINGLHGGWMPMAGQSDIYVARNVLANDFLSKKQFDTVIYIDDDIGFTRTDFQRLVECPEPFVSGLYTNKMEPPMPFCRDEDGKDVPIDEIPPDGMLKTRFLPGGFLKVHRSVYEAIIEAKIVPTYNNGKFHQFYNGAIFNENLLSEDYSFSGVVAHAAGIQAWIHCGIRLNHDGRTFGWLKQGKAE